MKIRYQFQGLAGAYNCRTFNGKVFLRGAFAATLGSTNPVTGVSNPCEIPLLFRHERELGTARVRDTPEGVEVVNAEFVLASDRSADAAIIEELDRGMLRGLSLGYRIRRQSWDSASGPKTVYEAYLDEVSLVREPSNPVTSILNLRKNALTQRELLGAN